MKANGALGVQAHLFLILALDEGEWLISCPGHFTARKEPQYPLNMRLGGSRSWCGCFEVYILRQTINHRGNILSSQPTYKTVMDPCSGQT